MKKVLDKSLMEVTELLIRGLDRYNEYFTIAERMGIQNCMVAAMWREVERLEQGENTRECK